MHVPYARLGHLCGSLRKYLVISLLERMDELMDGWTVINLLYIDST